MQIEHKSHLHTLIHKIEVVEQSWKPFTDGNLKRKFVLHFDEKGAAQGRPVRFTRYHNIDSEVQQLDQG